MMCTVQLYLPPEYMMNKDFLKAVFKREKALLKLAEVKRINVPLYDELAVTSIWPMVKNDRRMMCYFPEKLPKGRVPDREYFYNILNTFHGDYVHTLVKHANEQRNSASEMARPLESIEIDDEWFTQLMEQPFISRKYRHRFSLCKSCLLISLPDYV